jgi:hypothetical protein
MAQAPWVAREWLGEAALGALLRHIRLDRAGGGNRLLRRCGVAMLLRQLLRSFIPVHAMIPAALAVTLVIPHVLARPHIFTADSRRLDGGAGKGAQ